MINKDSILVTVKKLMNIDPTEQAFDTDIVLLINSEFMVLKQLGIGPENGFSISNYDAKWSDFTEDQELIDTLKIYVALRVRMIFDPPASSIVADAINSRISELEWRLNAHAERNYIAEHQDEFPSDYTPQYYSDKKNYEVDGENLTIFERPRYRN